MANLLRLMGAAASGRDGLAPVLRSGLREVEAITLLENRLQEVPDRYDRIPGGVSPYRDFGLLSGPNWLPASPKVDRDRLMNHCEGH
jgi:hypothetical protein